MQVGRIQLFPIKSLDGISVAQAAITPGGILEHDRVYALFDHAGHIVNGKRTARIHELRCTFDAGINEVWLSIPGGGGPVRFSLDAPAALERSLSEFFGFAVWLKYEPVQGFPDDHTASGPTITSEASLQAVQSWFPELTIDQVRRRFRTNLELLGTEAFGEDRLFGAPDSLPAFHIGEVPFLGHNPCQRCVVPTRDPDTGQATADFQKKFMALRRQTLPAWANAGRFNHFYRFTVNTSIPAGGAGRVLRVGDRVI